MDKTKELHKKALEAVERISEEEKRLIREIVEVSPNSIMYMGYIPIHIRGVKDDENADESGLSFGEASKYKKRVKCPLCGYGFFLWTPGEEVYVICPSCGYEFVV